MVGSFLVHPCYHFVFFLYVVHETDLRLNFQNDKNLNLEIEEILGILKEYILFNIVSSCSMIFKSIALILKHERIYYGEKENISSLQIFSLYCKLCLCPCKNFYPYTNIHTSVFMCIYICHRHICLL